jgi:hypothetical protein
LIFVVDNAYAGKHNEVMNKLSTEKRVEILRCLVDGNSIRATARLTDTAINSVVKLLIAADCC